MEVSSGTIEGIPSDTKPRVNKALKWLGGIIGLLFVGVIMMAVLDICPPRTLRITAPWCTVSSIDTEVDDGLRGSSKGADESLEELRGEVVTRVAEIVYDQLTCAQRHYDRNIIGLGLYVPEFWGVQSPETIARFTEDGYLDCLRFLECAGPYSIPTDFLKPLSGDGVFSMPGGVCEDRIDSQVRFLDLAGEVISGERLLDEEVLSIDMATLTSQEPEGESLEGVLVEVLQPGDMRLTTTDGWNEVLWAQLVELQQPMDSFVEYHLWNLEDDLEAQVSEWVVERMQIMDIPDIVIEVFQESDGTGWYASIPAEPENAIASMDVTIKFVGDMTGEIKERRAIEFSMLGQVPELGPITGSGRLNFIHPILGHLYFDLDFIWEYWDRMGRVSGGELRMIELNSGYEIQITIKPDGTKQGRLYLDDALIGRVDMIELGDTTSMELYPLD